MFQRRVYITKNSYVELSTRIFDGKDQLLLTIFGPKNENESVISSVILDDNQAAALNKIMTDAMVREKSWPIPEDKGEKAV